MEEALEDRRGLRLLWLEILVNDRIDVTPWRGRAEVSEAHVKACRWYHTYRSLIDSVVGRSPLPYRSVDLLLVGGLALQAYGYADRSTQDVAGEVTL